MPFYLRQIVPVDVGRNFAEKDEENKHKLVDSQEEAVNRSLANIIRQLASVGAHASDLFGRTQYVPNYTKYPLKIAINHKFIS